MTLRRVSHNPQDREATAGIAGLLARLEAAEAALLFSAAVDIALVLNADGTVAESVITTGDLQGRQFGSWAGRAWSEVSTIESQPKIEQMIQEAALGLPPRWRPARAPQCPQTRWRPGPASWSWKVC